MGYSIGEFSKATGIGIHTLRYYEKEGLITPGRSAAGRRVYGEEDIAWAAFILRLKETGMPLRSIRRYAGLRYAGDETMRERLEMLSGHRKYILEEIQKWKDNLASMDKKIKIYEEKIARAKDVCK
jgi:DNA-binding transcriptional MerR regulator